MELVGHQATEAAPPHTVAYRYSGIFTNIFPRKEKKKDFYNRKAGRGTTSAYTANTMNSTGLFSLSDTPFKDIGLHSERKADEQMNSE
jgi:hypothetical protein